MVCHPRVLRLVRVSALVPGWSHVDAGVRHHLRASGRAAAGSFTDLCMFACLSYSFGLEQH